MINFLVEQEIPPTISNQMKKTREKLDVSRVKNHEFLDKKHFEMRNVSEKFEMALKAALLANYTSRQRK